MVQKKVYDRVCSLHLIKNRFFFVIFSFCIPKHTICFKQTFFFMQQKKCYTYLKNLKNLDVKNKKKKSCKIIILRAKHFNLYYFFFYFRSIDKKIKELEAKNFYELNNLIVLIEKLSLFYPYSLHPTPNPYP